MPTSFPGLSWVERDQKRERWAGKKRDPGNEVTPNLRLVFRVADGISQFEVKTQSIRGLYCTLFRSEELTLTWQQVEALVEERAPAEE